MSTLYGEMLIIIQLLTRPCSAPRRARAGISPVHADKPQSRARDEIAKVLQAQYEERIVEDGMSWVQFTHPLPPWVLTHIKALADACATWAG